MCSEEGGCFRDGAQLAGGSGSPFCTAMLCRTAVAMMTESRISDRMSSPVSREGKRRFHWARARAITENVALCALLYASSAGVLAVNENKWKLSFTSTVFTFAVRNSSCGRVMFSQASVILWGGCAWWRGTCMANRWWAYEAKGGVCGKQACVWQGGHTWQREACMTKGACMAGGMCGGEHAWHGAYMAGEHVWQGTCVAGDGHCSRWYTSYWNVFLLKKIWTT